MSREVSGPSPEEMGIPKEQKEPRPITAKEALDAYFRQKYGEEAFQERERQRMVYEEFKGAWKNYIRERLTSGLSPEDIRDPDKLLHPKGEEYDRIAEAFAQYYGYGDSWNKPIEEAIREVLGKRSVKLPPTRSSRRRSKDLLRQLRKGPTGSLALERFPQWCG